MMETERKYKPYPEYKESGIEWLGEIPKHWTMDRLKWSSLGCINGIWGGDAEGLDNDIICVRVADFDRVGLRVRLNNSTFRAVSKKDRRERILLKGDLLLEKSGGGDVQPVGIVVMYDHHETAVCSNFVARMPVSGDFNPSFLTYLHASLYSSRVNTRSIKQTTGIQNLDSSSYLNEKVVNPPLPEQGAIASFLDRETTRIDELIAKKEQLIALLEEKRTALISQAVTKGLNPDAKMKNSGIEWLGEIPAHWSVMELKYLTPDDRQIMYGIVLPGPDYDGGIPIVKGGNCEPGKLRLENMSRTSPDIESRYTRSRLKTGDIVYAIRGSIGCAEMVPKELEGANLTQDAARISPKNGIHKQWLLFSVRSYSFFSKLDSQATGATIRGINIYDLKRGNLAVPPYDEQNEIAEYLERQTNLIDTLVKKNHQVIEKLQEYRTALISAAVTGKIDVRDQT